MLVKRICLICNKEFYVMKWKIFQGRGKLCSVKCRREWQKKFVIGSANKNWKGGKFIKDGYVFIWIPQHPFHNRGGYVRQHRLIMEQHLGRFLKPEEKIHHINHIKSDNRLENLKLLPNQSAHSKLHPTKSGWHHTGEVKKKLSEARKGFEVSQKTKLKIAESMKLLRAKRFWSSGKSTTAK